MSIHADSAAAPASELNLIRHSSPFARLSLLAYVVLILYASWYPFTGWQANNLSALPEVLRQWPRYWTWFDVITNVIGYVPLGALFVFALYPVLKRWWAVIIAGIAGSCISVTAELVQYFLPSRVTSVVDILTNSSGAILGALLAAWLTPWLMEKGRLRLLRKQWTYQESSQEIVILGLWPMAQLYPQAYLFGLGGIFPILSEHLSQFFDMDIDLSALILRGTELTPEEYLLAEALITACGCTGALLLCMSLLNRHAPKFWLSALLLSLAIVGKSLAAALFFQPEYAFGWLTPGARGGLLISAIMLYGFSFAPLHVQKRLAFVLMLLGLSVLNILPDNPYFSATMQTWVQGKFLNFNGAAQFLSLFWPFLALWALLRKPAPHTARLAKEETQTPQV